MSFRRFAAILLTTTVAFVSTSLLAFATPALAATITVDGFTYETSGTTATVTGYTGGAVANIPTTFDHSGTTYSVTIIGNYAFAFNNLTTLTIPDSVTTISNSAFRNNNLTTLTIPDSVTTIGNDAFYINNLTTLTIGNSVTTIGAFAFYGNDLTTLTIPDSVTTIGNDAFESNDLTTLTIGNSVTTIGNYAFRNNNLTTLTIPGSVTTIGAFAFNNNDLTTLTIPDSVTTIGDFAFANNPNISSAVFNGNAPAAGTNIFGGPSPLPTVFYYAGATGFTNPWTISNYPTQVVSAAASSLTITPSGPLLSDGTSTYTATLTVMSGNPGTPVTGFPADFTLPSAVTASATRCITDTAGVCAITLTSTAAGTYAISTLDGAAPANLTANATFNAVPRLAEAGANTGPVPYTIGGAVLILGVALTVVAARRRKAVR